MHSCVVGDGIRVTLQSCDQRMAPFKTEKTIYSITPGILNTSTFVIPEWLVKFWTITPSGQPLLSQEVDRTRLGYAVMLINATKIRGAPTLANDQLVRCA